MQVPLTILFITDFKGSSDSRLGLPLWNVWLEKEVGCRAIESNSRRTHEYTCTRRAQPPYKRCLQCWLTSSQFRGTRVTPEGCRGRPRFVWSHPAVELLEDFKWCSLIKGKLSRFNESREDWKWHCINSDCQTTKHFHQRRWAADESGCRKTFGDAEPSGVKGGSMCDKFSSWPKDKNTWK